MNSDQSITEYSQNNILVLPQALYKMTDATCLIENGGSAIFYKDLDRDLVNVEFYSNSPCFVYIKSGREVITSWDDNIHEMTTGSVTFLPQGVNLHSDYVKTSARLKAYLFFMSEDIVKEYLRSQRKFEKQSKAGQSNHINKFHTFKGSSALNSYLEGITSLHDQEISSPELVRLKMLEFLHIISLSNTHENEITSLSTVLSSIQTISPKRNVKRLMQNPEMLRLTVSDLAKLSGRSLSSFNRDFRASYNMPPLKWLRSNRLAYAQKLLEEKEMTVTEVSIEVGYDNISHFIKSFKEQYGHTPKEYRIQNQHHFS